MSIESVAKALHTHGLTATQKLVLVGIANHDGDGGAWPSMETLALYAECSERHARRTVRELEALGLVTTYLNQGGTATTPSDRRPNRYDLHLDGGTQHVRPRGDPGVRTGGHTGPVGGDTRVRGTVPEPSWKPVADPVDNVTSVDDLPEGKMKDRIRATWERGSGHDA